MRVETDAGARLRTVLEQAPALRRRGPRRAADAEDEPEETPERDTWQRGRPERDTWERGTPGRDTRQRRNPQAPTTALDTRPLDEPGKLDELLSADEEPRPLLRRVGPQHLQGLAILAVVVLVFVAMHLLRARPSQVPLAAPSLAAAPTGTLAPSASTTALPAPAAAPSVRPEPVLLKVHVVGEVRRPGVVSLREGARIQDAIQAAGGFTSRANPGLLNLASPVVDGMQVVVAGPGATSTANPPTMPAGAPPQTQGAGPSAAAPGQSGGGDQVNLNTASQAQLETLPGVGPVMAGKILDWRKEHGQFTRVEELQEVSGVGAKTFERLKPLVTV